MRLRGLAPGALVVVSLHGPREKYWGLLVQMGPAGVVVRGIDVNTFDDWLKQEAGKGDRLLGASTAFFPMARVERVELDETVGPVPGLSDVFRARTGRDPARVLRSGPSTRTRTKAGK